MAPDLQSGKRCLLESQCFYKNQLDTAVAPYLICGYEGNLFFLCPSFLNRLSCSSSMTLNTLIILRVKEY